MFKQCLNRFLLFSSFWCSCCVFIKKETNNQKKQVLREVCHNHHNATTLSNEEISAKESKWAVALVSAPHGVSHSHTVQSVPVGALTKLCLNYDCDKVADCFRLYSVCFQVCYQELWVIGQITTLHLAGSLNVIIFYYIICWLASWWKFPPLEEIKFKFLYNLCLRKSVIFTQKRQLACRVECI